MSQWAEERLSSRTDVRDLRFLPADGQDFFAIVAQSPVEGEDEGEWDLVVGRSHPCHFRGQGGQLVGKLELLFAATLGQKRWVVAAILNPQTDCAH